MSLLDDVQFMDKYDREEAWVKLKNRLLINAKIELYKCFKEGDDPALSNTLVKEDRSSLFIK